MGKETTLQTMAGRVLTDAYTHEVSHPTPHRVLIEHGESADFGVEEQKIMGTEQTECSSCLSVHSIEPMYVTCGHLVCARGAFPKLFDGSVFTPPTSTSDGMAICGRCVDRLDDGVYELCESWLNRSLGGKLKELLAVRKAYEAASSNELKSEPIIYCDFAGWLAYWKVRAQACATKGNIEELEAKAAEIFEK